MKNVIKLSRNSILFKDDDVWIKKEMSFDTTMGSFGNA